MIKYKHVVVIPNTGEQPVLYCGVSSFLLNEIDLCLRYPKHDPICQSITIPRNLISKIIVTM